MEHIKYSQLKLKRDWLMRKNKACWFKHVWAFDELYNKSLMDLEQFEGV